jgi:hypothetical protein
MLAEVLQRVRRTAEGIRHIERSVRMSMSDTASDTVSGAAGEEIYADVEYEMKTKPMSIIIDRGKCQAAAGSTP